MPLLCCQPWTKAQLNPISDKPQFNRLCSLSLSLYCKISMWFPKNNPSFEVSIFLSTRIILLLSSGLNHVKPAILWEKKQNCLFIWGIWFKQQWGHQCNEHGELVLRNQVPCQPHQSLWTHWLPHYHSDTGPYPRERKLWTWNPESLSIHSSLHVHCYLHTGSKSQKWILHMAPEKIMPD